MARSPACGPTPRGAGLPRSRRHFGRGRTSAPRLLPAVLLGLLGALCLALLQPCFAPAPRPSGTSMRPASARPPTARPAEGGEAAVEQRTGDSAELGQETGRPEAPAPAPGPTPGMGDAPVAEARREVQDLSVGEELAGTVQKLVRVGAFVDVGVSRQGLVPRNKLTRGFTQNAEDVVKVGQQVTVWVSEATNEKFILSMVKEKAYAPSQSPKADVAQFRSLAGENSDGEVFWLTGRVARIMDFGVFVALRPPGEAQAEAQGLLHRTQIRADFRGVVSEEFQIGSPVRVRVLSVDGGKMALSMREPKELAEERAQKELADQRAADESHRGADLADFEALVGADEWLDGTVKVLIRGGALVSLKPPGGEAEALGLVLTQNLREEYTQVPADAVAVGQQVKVRVLSVDKPSRTLQLSMIKAKQAPVESSNAPELLEPFEALAAETWFMGTVASVLPDYVLVDIKVPGQEASGAKVRGQVRKNQIRNAFIEDATKELTIGKEVRLRKLLVNATEGKLLLSMKDPPPEDLPPVDLTPLKAFLGRGEFMSGKVVALVDFGVFVDVPVPPGGLARGLVHSTELRSPDEKLAVGQSVDVRVIAVDTSTPKLGLSMKEVPAVSTPETVAPFEGLHEKNTWMDGKVIRCTQFGAFLEVVEPASGTKALGLLHASQISESGYVVDPSAELKKGDEVRVRVLSVDVAQARLALTRKKMRASTADLMKFEKYARDQWLQGEVVAFQNFGAYVKVTHPEGGEAVEGMLETAEFDPELEDLAEGLEIGQPLQVRVLQVKSDQRRLYLSARPLGAAPAES